MTTHAGEKIGPYFNAGAFVVRPQQGLMAVWPAAFQRWVGNERISSYCERSPLYRVFIHQVIFTAVLLNRLEPRVMHLLSRSINYPIHLHAEVPLEERPTTLNELVTLRYEDVFDQPGWEA